MGRRRYAALLAVVAMAAVVGACGGSGTPAPSVPAPSGAASVGASPAPAGVLPEVSGALPSIALPSFASDKDLEALLPDTYKGVALEKRSIKDPEVLGQNPTINAIVTALGLGAADVSVASSEDVAGTLGVSFEAIRFAGADSDKLLQVFRAASLGSGILVGSVNLGGKAVIKNKDTSGAGSFSYFYVRGDVVIDVTAQDDPSAAAALAVLP